MFASVFVTLLLGTYVLTLLYCIRRIYIPNFNLKMHWTKRWIDWTKGRNTLLALRRGAVAACNGTISIGGPFLGGRSREISGAYRRRGCRAFRAALSTARLPAVWWSGRTSRPGRGSVPPEAATGRIHLKPAQQRVLEVLASRGSAELTRGEYQEISGVSRSQAAYDLAELVEAGVLERLGGGRATRYRSVRRSQAGQRRWTSERIRTELAEFCGGEKEWPSAGAFKAAGRADLYVAASRYGGIGFWAVELGYPRPGRAASARAPEPPLVRKLAWAGGGALAAALVGAAAAAVVVLSLPHGSARTGGPAQASPPAAAGDRIVDESSHTLRKSSPAPARTAKTVRRAHARTVRRTHTPPAQPSTSSNTATLIAVRTYSPPSSSSTTLTGHQSTPTSTASAGPSPLQAPLTASAPKPIKAP